MYTRKDPLIDNSKDLYENLRQTLIDELETKNNVFNNSLIGLNSDYIEYEEKTDNLVFDLLKLLPV